MRPLWAALLLTGCATKHSQDHLEKQLEREVVALNQVVRDLRHQVANCGQDRSSPDSIFADLHQAFAGTDITVEREGSVTVVALPIGVLFTDPYSLRFREEANLPLDLMATTLQLHPNHRVELQGHTDNALLPRAWVRRYGSHLELSFLYAAAVMQRLSEDYGVGEDRFTVAARGQWAPIASNDVASGQARNRRVELRIRPEVVD